MHANECIRWQQRILHECASITCSWNSSFDIQSITCRLAKSKHAWQQWQTQICAFCRQFFTPFTVFARKGPGAAHKQYWEPFMISREKQNRKALTTPQKLSLYAFPSPPLSPFLFLSQSFVLPRQRHSFWMISAAKGLGGGGVRERVRKGAKAAVASVRGPDITS